jgi:hypothetical protein
MDTIQTFWNDANVYLQSGFGHINAVQGLLIAFIAAVLMYRWTNVVTVAAAAAVVHVVADVMLPVLANSAPFRLPPLTDSAFWRYLLALYVGYLVVISVFYIVKRVLLGVRHQADA